MTTNVPSFIDSIYLIIDERGWRLKENASDQLIREFKKYMNSLNMIKEENHPYSKAKSSEYSRGVDHGKH